MARRERFQTKLEIIKLASEMFLTQGYTDASTKKLAEELDISLGNLNYHFPTKEHLLAELTTRLCDYHLIVMETEIDEGRTSLLAYLLELTSMMAICEENEVAKDLYTSVYKHSMSLKLIRESDTEKVKHIFAEYCPDWTDEDFALTENAVSGLEYASLMRENADDVPLDSRVVKTLRVVMKAYNVPEEIREQKIQKVLSLDYRRIGRQFIEGFTEYVEMINEQALKEAHGK
ncbi:MAG: TetR/AcrR family transcriptional regulator [Oscillospiraceae bacterium]|nr:TetR/AcrR family transcriptional regulator [Oscillospiraceae bacterium]